MKVKPLLSNVNRVTFLADYLMANNVTDVERYLHPTGQYNAPENYVDIDLACHILGEHLHHANSIGILCDEDADGQFSSTVIYLFLKQLTEKVEVFFHKTPKAHGLTTSGTDPIFYDILDSDISLLIIPDASIDANCARELHEHDIDSICLDHHNYDFTSNPYAIIVNCLQQDTTNQNASGTLVTAKFCQRYAEIYNVNCPDFTDLVASSLISDVMDLRSMENRQYLSDWLGEWKDIE